MKPSEYYQKYWLIDYGNGPEHPPPLRQHEIDFLDSTVKLNKMKSDFKLTGLSKPHRISCEPLDNENIFWPNVGLTKDRFDALFNYTKGHWKDIIGLIAEIEHDGIRNDGTPINGTIVGIREL